MNLTELTRMPIRLRRAFALFSLEREYEANDVWWTIGTAALLGAMYGIFVNPYWSEAVEFGQAWAGLVDYRLSPWGEIIFSRPSLQIVVPAFLLRVGFHVWTLSLAMTAFFCATSFAAVAAACFVFTRNISVSVACSLFLLNYEFIYSHGYAVGYPIGYFQFGTTGMYFALLGLSLAACGWPIAAGLIGGTLGGVHAVWAILFPVGTLPITAWLERKSLPRLLIAFTASLIGSLGLLYYSGNVMQKPTYSPPRSRQVLVQTSSSPATDLASRSNPASEANKTKDGMSKAQEESPNSKKPIRGHGHDVLFADAPSPLKAAAAFFSPEFVFLYLVIAFYIVQRASSLRSANFLSTWRLLCFVALSLSLAFLFKMYEEIDPDFYILGLADQRLPSLMLLAVFNRWFNLSTVLIPVMTLSLLAVLIRDNRSWLAAATFGALALLDPLSSFWGDTVLHKWLSPFVILIALLIITYQHIRGKLPLIVAGSRHGFVERGPSLIFGVALVCFFALKLSSLARDSYVERPFAGSDSADGLAAVASADQGPLIVSPNVISVRGFNPQLRTGRPIIPLGLSTVFDSTTDQQIAVFCYTDRSLPLDKVYANVRPCFEGRPPWDWAVIAGEAQATGLITPATWKLTIPPTFTGGGFSYYRLPQPAAKWGLLPEGVTRPRSALEMQSRVRPEKDPVGYVESVTRSGPNLAIEGWAADDSKKDEVVLLRVYASGNPIGVGMPWLVRRDVNSARHLPERDRTGFRFAFPAVEGPVASKTEVRVFAEFSDGTVGELKLLPR